MRGTIVALHLAVLTVLGGCAVGPDYQPPAKPTGAEGPLVSLNPAVETAEAPPDDWWKLYDEIGRAHV